METTNKTSCCDHIRWGAVDPVRIEVVEDHPVGFSDGEVTFKTYTEIFWQCPICHQIADVPIEERENGESNSCE